MVTVAGLIGVILLLVSVSLVKRAMAALRLLGEVLARRQQPIATVERGMVEVSGTIAAFGGTHPTLAGARAAAVRTRVAYSKKEGKSHTALNESVHVAGDRCLLRDETGACVVELAGAEIVGDCYMTGPFEAQALASVDLPWKSAPMPEGTTHLDVTEDVVPDGAKVMVTASVLEDAGPSPLTDSGGYRDATVRRRLGSTPERSLLLVVGGQRSLFARSLVGATAALVGALWVGVHGLLLAAVALLY